jgi:hypothetical protein
MVVWEDGWLLLCFNVDVGWILATAVTVTAGAT